MAKAPKMSPKVTKPEGDDLALSEQRERFERAVDIAVATKPFHKEGKSKSRERREKRRA